MRLKLQPQAKQAGRLRSEAAMQVCKTWGRAYIKSSTDSKCRAACMGKFLEVLVNPADFVANQQFF